MGEGDTVRRIGACFREYVPPRPLARSSLCVVSQCEEFRLNRARKQIGAHLCRSIDQFLELMPVRAHARVLRSDCSAAVWRRVEQVVVETLRETKGRHGTECRK